VETITVIFTKRKWNPVSLLIRWAIPRSRLSLAESSHCLVKDGDYYIEANMLHKVRRSKADVAMKGLTVVKTVYYQVPNAEVGLAYGRTQVGKKYDWGGAFGLLDPDRNWTAENSWFCYELTAAILRAAGRDQFNELGHITGTTLLALKP